MAPSTSLALILTQYKRQFQANPATADRSLLEQARRVFQGVLQQQTPLEPEVVHQGHELYLLLDDRPAVVDLMSRYLRQPLPVEEEAWARWEQVDYMAALAYPQGGEPCKEVVERHKEFLAWAREHLPTERLLWVMYDGTQAVCWRLAGKGEEWVALFHEIMAIVIPTAENRYDRFLYLRTAAVAMNVLGRPEESLRLGQRMHALCEEDPMWERAFEVRVNAFASALDTYSDLGNLHEVRRIGTEAAAFLHEYERQNPATDREQARRLSTAYANLGAGLLFAKQYDLSIPLEEHAVTLGTRWAACDYSEWTCLRLAAAVWATTRDRSQTLAWLRKGATVCPGPGLDLHNRPELADVAQDPEFISSARTPGR